MSLEQQLLTTIRNLPPEGQQEVLDFAEFLTQKRLSPLEQILADIRQRAAEVDPEELDSLIEEARQDFYDHRQP
jgi:hypothetical protein